MKTDFSLERQKTVADDIFQQMELLPKKQDGVIGQKNHQQKNDFEASEADENKFAVNDIDSLDYSRWICYDFGNI